MAVAKCQSFSKAALESNVTRSALSQQIRKLEQELGVSLFKRTTRTVYMTPAGKEFMRTVPRVMQELETLKMTMREYTRAERGDIKIGNFPSLGAYGIIPRIAAFQKAFPKVQIIFYESECENLLHMLEEGSIDAAFFTAVYLMQPKGIGLDAYPVTDSELVLEVNAQHRFASRKSVDWSELADEPLVAPPAFSGVRLDIEDAFRRAGITPNYLSYTGTSDTSSSFVAAGVGSTITSMHAHQKSPIQGTVCIPLIPKVSRIVYFVVPKNAKPSLLLDNFKFFSLQWGGAAILEPLIIRPADDQDKL